MVVAFGKTGKTIESMGPRMAFKSKKAGVGEISIRSYSYLFMSLAWIPKGILEKIKEDLFQILMGRLKGPICFSMGELGRNGSPKNSWRMGIKEHFSLLQSTSGQVQLETDHKRQFVDQGGQPKVYPSRIDQRMDQKSGKGKRKLHHYMESSLKIISCHWGKISMESRKRKQGQSWNRPLAWKWEQPYSARGAGSASKHKRYLLYLSNC